MAEAESEKVQRVVRGGATMYPQETPRPQPLVTSDVVRNFVTCAIRGPLLATLLTKALHPSYSKWIKTYMANGSTESGAFALAMSGVHVGMYVGSFLFFELGGMTEWMHQYQLPRTHAQEPTTQMKLRTLGEFVGAVVLHHFVAFRGVFKLFKWFGMPSATADLPSLPKMFLQFSFSYMFNRIFFGIVHRLFHHGPLYRAFHKKHHEYVGTISIAAENAHPLEAIGANTIPSLGGALLAAVHPLVLYVWFAWRLQQTYEAHSGYCFHGTFLHKLGLTNADSTAFHDFHHTENKGAFGCEFTDHFFGSMDKWIAVGRAEGYVKLAREQHAREKVEKKLREMKQ